MINVTTGITRGGAGRRSSGIATIFPEIPLHVTVIIISFRVKLYFSFFLSFFCLLCCLCFSLPLWYLQKTFLIRHNDHCRSAYFVIGRNKSYFVIKKYYNSNSRFSEADIIKMLALMIGHIFVIFGGRVWHSYGYQPRSSSRRLVPLFVWNIFHLGFFHFSFTFMFRYLMMPSH